MDGRLIIIIANNFQGLDKIPKQPEYYYLIIKITYKINFNLNINLYNTVGPHILYDFSRIELLEFD